MKRNILCLLFIVVVAVAGCSHFEPYVGEDGQTHTIFGDNAKMVSDSLTASSKVLPLPIGGLIATIGGAIGLIGLAATSIVSAKKSSGTLEAVIRGVEEANNPAVKETIRKVAGDSGYQQHLRKLVARYTGKV